MTNKDYQKQRREYMRQYAHDYRAEGFGRIIDRDYRQRHLEDIRRKDRVRKRLLRALKNKPRREVVCRCKCAVP